MEFFEFLNITNATDHLFNGTTENPFFNATTTFFEDSSSEGGIVGGTIGAGVSVLALATLGYCYLKKYCCNNSSHQVSRTSDSHLKTNSSGQVVSKV